MAGSTLAVLLGVFGLSSLACSVGEQSAPQEARGENPPVVLVIFDELPTTALLDGAGRLSRSRFPNFHGLATETTWYRNNTTVADFTSRAVPAILTGQRPNAIFPDFRKYRDSIFSFLGTAGYSFRVMEIFTQVCPPKVCPDRIRPRVDLRPDETTLEFGQRILKSIPDRTAHQNDWIDGLRALQDGDAAVGHFLLPHIPHRFLPNGMKYKDLQRRIPVVDDENDRIVNQPGMVDVYHQRLLMQLGFADRLLGQVVKNIKASGVWDRATVIVTADHGISLEPGTSRRTVEEKSLYGIGMTPLFVKLPGQKRGKVSRSMTATVDILPTIAAAIGRLESLHKTSGVPVGTRPAGKRRAIHRSDGRSFRFSREGATTWLKRQALMQARRLGDRGLDALGSHAGHIGKRSPDRSRLRARLVDIPDLPRLRSIRKPALLPALIEGFVRGRKLPDRAELLLSLNGRWVASSRVFVVDDRRAFSFLVHPRFLPDRKLRKLRIYRLTRSGRAVRVF